MNPEPAMKARIVRIGNSRGVRIPKTMLEEAGLEGAVELSLGPDGILIAQASRPRSTWTNAARLVRDRGEGNLLDDPVPSRFELLEWEWDEGED